MKSYNNVSVRKPKKSSEKPKKSTPKPKKSTTKPKKSTTKPKKQFKPNINVAMGCNNQMSNYNRYVSQLSTLSKDYKKLKELVSRSQFSDTFKEKLAKNKDGIPNMRLKHMKMLLSTDKYTDEANKALARAMKAYYLSFLNVPAPPDTIREGLNKLGRYQNHRKFR